MLAVSIWLSLVLSNPVFLLGQEISDTLDKHLHKNAVLGIGLSPFVPTGESAALSGHLILSPRMAAAFAVFHLRQMGVGNILICESHWIAAPLSGYLVDALGNCTLEGKNFLVFRIGIRDGGEAIHGKEYSAGVQFVFIALGWDSLGKQIWYPQPGPDYHLSVNKDVPQGALSYEFLLRRDEFENLPIRYKSPK